MPAPARLRRRRPPARPRDRQHRKGRRRCPPAPPLTGHPAAVTAARSARSWSRVVTVDEYATLLALEVGVEPAAAFAGYRAESLGRVIADAGIDQLPHRYTEPNDEAVAAARSDLIIATASTDPAALFDGYSQIARTVIIPFIAPWTAQLDIAAAALDRRFVRSLTGADRRARPAGCSRSRAVA